MAAANDVMQLVLRGTYLGQNWTNVFHYRITAVGTVLNSAAALNNGFGASVLPAIRALANSGCTYVDMYTVNLGAPAEMDTLAISAVGLIGDPLASQLPSYIALKFKYERTSAIFRNGWKRFTGMVESQTTGNQYSGSVPNATSLATALGNTLAGVGGPGWLYSPFVARRPIVYGTNPAGYPTNTVLFQGVTTQNTRKP